MHGRDRGSQQDSSFPEGSISVGRKSEFRRQLRKQQSRGDSVPRTAEGQLFEGSLGKDSLER